MSNKCLLSCIIQDDDKTPDPSCGHLELELHNNPIFACDGPTGYSVRLVRGREQWIKAWPQLKGAIQPLTIAFWMNPNKDLEVNSEILGFMGQNSGLGFRYAGQNKYYFMFGTGTKYNNEDGKKNFTIDPDAWTHVILLFEQSIVTIYVNGILVLQYRTDGDQYVPFKCFFLGCGSWEPTGYFYGALADVRIYSKKLTEMEMATLAKVNKVMTSQFEVQSSIKASTHIESLQNIEQVCAVEKIKVENGHVQQQQKMQEQKLINDMKDNIEKLQLELSAAQQSVQTYQEQNQKQDSQLKLYLHPEAEFIQQLQTKDQQIEYMRADCKQQLNQKDIQIQQLMDQLRQMQQMLVQKDAQVQSLLAQLQ